MQPTSGRLAAMRAAENLGRFSRDFDGLRKGKCAPLLPRQIQLNGIFAGEDSFGRRRGSRKEKAGTKINVRGSGESWTN